MGEFLCVEKDKEYRKGVHWLETLRLRRTKILKNGYMVSMSACAYATLRSQFFRQSLEMFVAESAETMKKVLVKYTDNMV